MSASAYILELSVGPSGSRWGELHTWTERWQLRAILEQFCENDDNLAAYHSIFYGATLGVWVVQQGRLVEFVDLHPFILVTLPEGQRPLAEFLADQPARAAFLDGHEDEWLDDVELTLFWDPVEERLPPLLPPLLGPEDEVAFTSARLPNAPADSYLEFANPLSLRSIDYEAGELEPPFELPS